MPPFPETPTLFLHFSNGDEPQGDRLAPEAMGTGWSPVGLEPQASERVGDSRQVPIPVLSTSSAGSLSQMPQSQGLSSSCAAFDVARRKEGEHRRSLRSFSHFIGTQLSEYLLQM